LGPPGSLSQFEFFPFEKSFYSAALECSGDLAEQVRRPDFEPRNSRRHAAASRSARESRNRQLTRFPSEWLPRLPGVSLSEKTVTAIEEIPRTGGNGSHGRQLHGARTIPRLPGFTKKKKKKLIALATHRSRRAPSSARKFYVPGSVHACVHGQHESTGVGHGEDRRRLLNNSPGFKLGPDLLEEVQADRVFIPRIRCESGGPGAAISRRRVAIAEASVRGGKLYNCFHAESTKSRAAARHTFKSSSFRLLRLGHPIGSFNELWKCFRPTATGRRRYGCS